MEPMEQQNMEPPKTSADKSATGPMIAIVVIVILLIVGGIYYLSESLTSARGGDQQYLEALMTQGSDDAASAIMADLDATDLAPIDAAVAEVDASLETE